MVAVERHINREYLDLFQSRLSGLGAESMLRYRRTISELDLFLTGHGLLLADLSPVMMADWAADLLLSWSVEEDRGKASQHPQRHDESRCAERFGRAYRHPPHALQES